MTRSVAVCSLLSLFMSVACSSAGTPEVAVAACPQELSGPADHTQGLSPQGMGIQGLQAQGLSPQGVSPQGMNLQGLSPQGLTAQGITAQGVSVQGVSVQGLSVQGISAQGISAQGIQPQGVSVQGLTPQGIATQGLTPQGISAQGISAQGISAQGIQAQGLGTQGLGSQGLQPQGITPQGFSTQGIAFQALDQYGNGLAALALRNVTPEQANDWLSGTVSTLPRDNLVRVRLERGILSGVTGSGIALAGQDLVGLLLPFIATNGQPLWTAITAVTPDPKAPEVPLYALSINGQSLCEDPMGGTFVPGIWDDTGARHDYVINDAKVLDTTFACTAGVITKCVVWGYKPWDVGATTHEACTRMARADYCGNGVPHTQNGTLIDLYDIHGIQTPVADDGMRFEAGWNENGAVCVSEPRYVDTTTSGTPILPSCWASKPKCSDFNAAQALGAELGNNSLHVQRVFDCGF